MFDKIIEYIMHLDAVSVVFGAIGVVILLFVFAVIRYFSDRNGSYF